MNVKKIIKSAFVFLLLIALAAAIFGVFIVIEASTAKLDEGKLTANQSGIVFYDSDNAEITEASIFSSVKPSDKLPKYVYGAFTSIEDVRFYSHNGYDVKRIFGAALSNLKSFSFKEGASTITQQLVKNTQLSSEKTVYRKAKEFKLAVDIEKKYSKQEIIDMYLNAIYFGSGCYGIENAADFYFNKKANELSINESAALAAMIKAPSKYSPFVNYEKLISRKNLVLKKMLESSIISQDEYDENIELQLTLNKNQHITNDYNDYIKAALNELSEILRLDIKHIKSQNYKVYTYMDKDLQQNVNKMLKNKEYYKDFESTDSVALVLSNSSFSVSALSVKSKLGLNQIVRQPGSAIKPTLVYAPALEYGMVTPATHILDEKTDFEGFCPSNYKHKYNGYIDARSALAQSLNVPAVKLLNATGIEKSKQMAARCGIPFDREDKGLGLALGGFKYGCNPLQLAASYIPFSNGGFYKNPVFIKKIVDGNGKTVYQDETLPVQTMRDDTAYLITDMLKTCAKTGTAKKLSAFDFDVAAKTGTVGNAEHNTDAYNVAYTNDSTFCVWMGGLFEEKLDLSVTGGAHPSAIARDMLAYKYKDSKPQDFARPDSVVKCDIDTEYLKINHSIKLASETTPGMFVRSELFSKKNMPIEISDLFLRPKVESPEVIYNNEKVTIKFIAKEYLNYDIERIDQDGTCLTVNVVKQKNGVVNFLDNNIKPGQIYQYVITPNFNNNKTNSEVTGEAFVSNKIIVPYKFSPEKPPKDEDYWWKDSDFFDKFS